MIELDRQQLVFSFPDLTERLQSRVRNWLEGRLATASKQELARLPFARDRMIENFVRHNTPAVRVCVAFQRTLRIPDDGRVYPLPPGLGRFPIHHVDDYADAPESWQRHGGAMLPMHRAEAMWIQFEASYPMALKIAAGGVCAVSGERWTPTLGPKAQNYVVLPDQPWLDGFRVSEGTIRQFVAVPLGKGLTVEKQLTDAEEWGGLQIQAYPLQIDRYWTSELVARLEEDWTALFAPLHYSDCKCAELPMSPIAEAGLGAGGRMKQEIIEDPWGRDAWDSTCTSRCFVHLCLTEDWERLTGSPPPTKPPTAEDYSRAGLPWFDYTSGEPAVTGPTALSGIKSICELMLEKVGLGLPENDSVESKNVIKLGAAQKGETAPSASQLIDRILSEIRRATDRGDFNRIAQLNELAKRVQAIDVTMRRLQRELTTIVGELNGDRRPAPASGPITVEIDFPKLGFNHPAVVISDSLGSVTLRRAIETLVDVIGPRILEPLSRLRVNRGPLISRDPQRDYRNPKSDQIYTHHSIGSTGYFVITHSSMAEKIRDLRKLAEILDLSSAHFRVRRNDDSPAPMLWADEGVSA